MAGLRRPRPLFRLTCHGLAGKSELSASRFRRRPCSGSTKTCQSSTDRHNTLSFLARALVVVNQLKVGSLISIDVFTEKSTSSFSLTPKGYQAGMAKIRAWGIASAQISGFCTAFQHFVTSCWSRNRNRDHFLTRCRISGCRV